MRSFAVPGERLSTGGASSGARLAALPSARVRVASGVGDASLRPSARPRRKRAFFFPAELWVKTGLRRAPAPSLGSWK